jgi:hypothetical protein
VREPPPDGFTLVQTIVFRDSFCIVTTFRPPTNANVLPGVVAVRFLFLSCLSVALSACAALHVSDHKFEDVDEGAHPHGDGGLDDPDPDPAHDALPTVMITTPQASSAVAAGTLRIEGTASDDQGLATVLVKVGPNVGLPAHSDDDFRNWWVESAIPEGMFFVEAVSYDLKGQASEPDRIGLIAPTTGSDDGAPTITVTSPADGSAPLHLLVLVQGTAQDDRAVVAIDTYRNGELLKNTGGDSDVQTDNFFASWSRLVPLVAGVDNELLFVARDAGGREGKTTIKLFGRAEADREPPVLTITSPQNHASLSATDLEVKGTASDNVGLRQVKMRVGSFPEGATNMVWSAYEDAELSNPKASDFTHRITAPSGALKLEVRAIDLNGLATSQTLELTNTFVPSWSEERQIPLRLRDTDAPWLNFALDEEGVNEVIAPNIQKDITLLQLDTTDLLTSSVNEIKDSCGTKWRSDDTDPHHDCSLTALGRTYGSAQGVPWQKSAEYSMVRLLTMTPKNAVVDGTSIAKLKDLANGLSGFTGGFQKILANTLGIPVTSEIVSTASVVKSLQDNWMSSHPEVLPGAKLGITLYDAMNDLTPLKDRFGPKGGHPGLLDPSFDPYSQVFGNDFELELSAQSNLRWMDGVDLSGAGGATSKDYIALVVDTTGPTYDDVLEFDFTDPAKFDVKGLVQAPKVNLRMSLYENSAWVNSCIPSRASESQCKANLPNAPLSTFVWSKPRYQVEPIVAGAALAQYKNRSNYRETYVLGTAEVTVGYNGNPAGWSTYWTLFNIGSPPESQYVWELILEVAQKALHNFSGTTLNEGDANMMFTLYGIDVGLTANEIRAAMRPELQKQRAKLSDKLLGDYQKNNGAVDFYYRQGADSAAYLFFAAASDPLPDGSYDYAKPGFFADEALANKVSSKDAGTSGDSAHEKLRLPEGETVVYASDETSSLFRLRFVVPKQDPAHPDPTREIQLYVSRKVR